MIICVYVGVYHSLDRSAVIRTYGRSELRVEDRVWVQGMAGMGRSHSLHPGLTSR